ncbi:hypothetical protein ACHWQZ_G018195 [Mnemiopsis leidyi]
MSHHVLQQISRFTNRTVKVKNPQKDLLAAGRALVVNANKQGYRDHWVFHQQHQPPKLYRSHYRFMEHKRMYNQGMHDRVDFVESGYTAKSGFKLERGVEDNAQYLKYKQTGNKVPVDREEWRSRYRHILNPEQTN